MFNEINKPYRSELEFYKEKNIPLWECPNRVDKFIGRIFESEGCYVDATVYCMPAHFYKFKIYCAETKTTCEIETGSGCLMDYYETMVNIAQGMIVIEKITKD